MTLLVVALTVMVGVLLLFASFAHAAPDPGGTATTATTDLLTLFTQYGLIPGLGILGFGILSTVLKANQSTHWIAQGRTLAILTGAASVGAAVIAWQFSGAPAAGVVTALVAAIGLILHPVTVPAVKGALAGSGGSIVALVVLAAALAPGCTPGSNARNTTATGIVAALDCEAAHLDPTLLADARAAADARVQGWISGTAPADLDALTAKVLADLGPFASDLGHCAIAGALAAALTIATNAVATHGTIDLAASAPPRPASARAAFAIAARRAGWTPVRVAGGAVY